MPQKKKEEYLYSCSSAKEIVNDIYKISEPVDFYEWSNLIENKTASERHHDEFDLRMIQHFMDKVYANELPESWVLSAIANAFMKVIHGSRWEDEFQLPWTKFSSTRSPSENKDLEIFCKISNDLSKNPNMKITNLIGIVASEFFVSYERARSAYYKFKKITGK